MVDYVSTNSLSMLGGDDYTIIQQDNTDLNNTVVFKGGTQTITGLKTFSTLPQSSVVPTTGNQLANKTYVDNATTGSFVDLTSPQTITGVKTFDNASFVVKTAGQAASVATKIAVDSYITTLSNIGNIDFSVGNAGSLTFFANNQAKITVNSTQTTNQNLSIQNTAVTGGITNQAATEFAVRTSSTPGDNKLAITTTSNTMTNTTSTIASTTGTNSLTSTSGNIALFTTSGSNTLTTSTGSNTMTVSAGTGGNVLTAITNPGGYNSIVGRNNYYDAVAAHYIRTGTAPGTNRITASATDVTISPSNTISLTSALDLNLDTDFVNRLGNLYPNLSIYAIQQSIATTLGTWYDITLNYSIGGVLTGGDLQYMVFPYRVYCCFASVSLTAPSFNGFTNRNLAFRFVNQAGTPIVQSNDSGGLSNSDDACSVTFNGNSIAANTQFRAQFRWTGTGSISYTKRFVCYFMFQQA